MPNPVIPRGTDRAKLTPQKGTSTADMTRADFDILEGLEWGERHFGGLLTSRVHPRRDMLRVVAKGWARSIGDVVVCDGDGFTIEPERWREGFAMTPAGQTALADARKRRGPNGYPRKE